MLFRSNRICLDQYAMFLTVGRFGVIHVLASKLPSLEAHISWTREGDGVEEGCFHLASLVGGFRFPFPDFILKLLNKYGIAPSQLAPNSWKILVTFYLGCKAMLVIPHSRLFMMFYSLCRKG